MIFFGFLLGLLFLVLLIDAEQEREQKCLPDLDLLISEVDLLNNL